MRITAIMSEKKAESSVTVRRQKTRMTKRTVKKGVVPEDVVHSILQIAIVLASADGVYRVEERKKIREVVKLFPEVRSSQAYLQSLDKSAERISAFFSKTRTADAAFSPAKIGVDVLSCLELIAAEPRWVYTAFIVWLGMCCCDGNYSPIERNVIDRMRMIVVKEFKVPLSPSFMEKAEMHLKNVVYLEGAKKEITDDFRKRNLRDVIAFEEGLLSRMMLGKEY